MYARLHMAHCSILVALGATIMFSNAGRVRRSSVNETTPEKPVAMEVELPNPVRINERNSCETSDWDCSAGHKWILQPPMLRRGSYGQVWAVSSADSIQAYPTVVKFPRSLGTSAFPNHEECIDIRGEAHKIFQLKSDVGRVPACRKYFMEVIDYHPCTSDFQPIVGYVMEQMDGDLNDWGEQYYNPACIDTLTSMVYDALTCFHDGGWVHSDVKLGNILYKGRDVNGCPLEVRLADYGMSGKKGQQSEVLFPYQAYFSAWYLPQDLFHIPDMNGTPHNYPLGLAHPRGNYYIYAPEIDWCAFHFAWALYFGTTVQVRPGDWHGNCGPMGPRNGLNSTNFFVDAPRGKKNKLDAVADVGVREFKSQKVEAPRRKRVADLSVDSSEAKKHKVDVPGEDDPAGKRAADSDVDSAQVKRQRVDLSMEKTPTGRLAAVVNEHHSPTSQAKVELALADINDDDI